MDALLRGLLSNAMVMQETMNVAKRKNAFREKARSCSDVREELRIRTVFVSKLAAMCQVEAPT